MDNDQPLKSLGRRLAAAALALCVAGGMAGQKQSKQRLKNQRQNVRTEMKKTRRQLDETTRTARLSAERLKELTRQVSERKQMIDGLNRDLSAIDSRIATADAELKRLEKRLGERKMQYATLVRALHERCSAQNKWIFLLSSDNFARFLRRLRYLHEYASWQKQQALTIVNRQAEIDEKRAALASVRGEKSDLLEVRSAELHRLKNAETEQRTGVRQLEERRVDLTRDLARQQQQADALDRRIELLASAEFASTPTKNAEQTAKKKRRQPDAPSKQDRKLSDDFAANRGRLPFPLDGRYKVVESFGRHRHKRWTYVRTTNNGIDIRTTKGTDARAVFTGTVTRVFVLPGYNYNVIIRHGRYLTVYGNLGRVYVKVGDRVATRQAIGRIYSDSENRDETVLHFQLWREKRKLNPLVWLD